MTVEPAIRVSGLSKRYRIGARLRERTLREAVVDAALAPVRRLRSFGRSSHRQEDSIWALKDVSFEVGRGEVLGVIGRNGAGKSTLLRILSRITDPTEGWAELEGRVGSLLEVGTGFHSELTGRENVYLSGAILGMKKAEIEARFDEIVEFSGVEPFIDTPVKRYSSGMRVRLGFAVAAHLEPEILLIDEVLAVGDAAFQRKCLGKMEDVSRSGRTVLFVSHNMAAVRHLCTSCLALEDGRVLALGEVRGTVEHYLESVCAPAGQGGAALAFDVPPPEPALRAYVTRVEVLDAEGRPAAGLATRSFFRARVRFHVREPSCRFGVQVSIATPDGVPVITYNSQRTAGLQLVCQPGDHYVDMVMSELPLSAGQYEIGAALHLRGEGIVHLVERAGRFEVAPSDVYGTGRPLTANASLLALDHTWHVPDDDPGLRVIMHP